MESRLPTPERDSDPAPIPTASWPTQRMSMIEVIGALSSLLSLLWAIFVWLN